MSRYLTQGWILGCKLFFLGGEKLFFSVLKKKLKVKSLTGFFRYNPLFILRAAPTFKAREDREEREDIKCASMGSILG